jgi:hypothetical protein
LLEASITLNDQIRPRADATEKDYLKSLAVLDRETIAAIGAMMGTGNAGFAPRAMRGAI